MSSLILSTATRYLLPLLLVFALFLMLRGHNAPGGGFVAGLAASAAFALFSFSFGVEATRRSLRAHPCLLLGVGLLLSVGSGFISLLFGSPYMTGIWSSVELPAIGKLGTPLLFDVGVFFVVLGMVMMIVLELAED